ncbi:MAG: hypothetical protein WAM39_28225 [Bryobacteraceae bacterium]
MKLRFRKNSLRLRLNQREVSAVAGGGSVEERVHFPGGTALVYRLVPGAAAAFDASVEGSTITVSVPRGMLEEWEQNEEIGRYHQAGALEIAIEKDLECVEARAEERDPYAFPRKAAC